jgi:MFS family permease
VPGAAGAMVQGFGAPAAVLLSVSAVGGLAAAVTTGRLAARIGHRRAIWLSVTVSAPFALLWPLSAPGAGAVLFGVGLLVVWYGSVVYNITQVSLRQALCPPEMLGRMNATMRFVAGGVVPVGALLGGGTAELAGNRVALAVCAALFLLTPLPVLFSPLSRPVPDDRP